MSMNRRTFGNLICGLLVVFAAFAAFAADHPEARSSKWPRARAAYLKGHPVCEACGAVDSKTNPLNVHHIRPFHEHPELELDPTNMITLCREDHFTLGHKGDWKGSNPNVKDDAARHLFGLYFDKKQ